MSFFIFKNYAEIQKKISGCLIKKTSEPPKKYITQGNYKNSEYTFMTKANIKIKGKIKIEDYNLMVCAYNRVHEPMKVNVKNIKLRGPYLRNKDTAGRWHNITKTMTLISHKDQNQKEYDYIAFHEAGHSEFFSLSSKLKDEWGDKIKDLFDATGYTKELYEIVQRGIRKYEYLEDKRDYLYKIKTRFNINTPKMKKALRMNQKKMQETREIIKEDISRYINEMYSEAYAMKYSHDKHRVNDQKTLKKLIKIFDSMFEE